MSTNEITPEVLESLGNSLADISVPLAKKYRNLFTLRNLLDANVIPQIAKGLLVESALFKHEVAFCLGQLKDPIAIPYLINVLQNKNEHTMVRHEAAEALGAIGTPLCKEVLVNHLNEPCIEVQETCQIAVDRIRYFEVNKEPVSTSPYMAVDPAPAFTGMTVTELKNKMLDTKLSLFDRYRAMFGLRDIGDDVSAMALTEGLKDSSALFRHEIAFLLGQLQNPVTSEELIIALEKEDENCMVRHEAAEALGSIATEKTLPYIKKYSTDKEDVVRESCEVALDIHSYNVSNEFQYADGLIKKE